MIRYRGTCIGGVADGHWIERDDAEIRIEKRKKACPHTLGENGPVDDSVLETTNYKFLLLLGTSNDEIGVWAPHDVSIEQVIKRLVRHYNPNAGIIGQPAPNRLPLKN